MATIAGRKTRQSLRSERAFFLSMTAAIFLLVVWGFSRSFYFRTVMDPPATWIDTPGWFGWVFVLHGMVFTMWLALFAAQVVLIGSRRLPLHKRVGQAAWPLYFAMVAIGMFVGTLGAIYGFHDVPFDSVTFSALPWIGMLSFAALAAMGLKERRDPQRHKRLMLLALIVISDAGIARVTYFQQILPPWITMTPFLLLPPILWDLATLRRVHPATILGSGLVILSLVASIPIGQSAVWHGFVNGVLGIPGVPAMAST